MCWPASAPRPDTTETADAPGHRSFGRGRSPAFMVAVAALALTLLPGGGGAQEHPDPAPWTGCWDVEWGAWRPPLPEHDTLAYLPPPRIELTADSVPGWGALDQEPAPGSLPTLHSITDWRPASRDSLWIRWSDGYIGTNGGFLGRGDTLRGELETFTDVIPHQKHRADAFLVRVPCSAPPDEPASDQRPVFRSVPLEGGDTVSLGSSLPEGRIRRFNETAYLLEGSPGGPFEGARDVRVRVSADGRAAAIRVSYDPSVPVDSLAGAFVDSLGSPARRTHYDGDSNIAWENRTTRLRLRITRSELHVYLSDPRLNWTIPDEHRRQKRGGSPAGPPSPR